ncbi:MAG TPA: hypothetical protein VGT40_27030 [Methylomirabilota bacterium]|jgi:hypothetical protein|nr:hypothetical protein [Methylomirabilota bacterium]
MRTEVRERRRSTSEMLNDCFRHQHPEAYGRAEIGEPVLPRELRYGPGENIPSSPVIPETPMGNPEAVPLP